MVGEKKQRKIFSHPHKNHPILDFTGAKDDGGGSNNCSYLHKMCKAIKVKLSTVSVLTSLLFVNYEILI